MNSPFQLDLIRKLSLNCPVYIVGGAVRDYLLNREFKDIDAVVPLPLGEIEAMVNNLGYTPHRLGRHKETVSVFLEQGRIDLLELNSCLEDDALNRDFTFNSIYFDVLSDKIIDPLNGQKDLMNRILKTCSSPSACFQNDPLRILRMVRFAVKYNLTIEPEVWSEALSLLPKLAGVPSERITVELGNILLLDDVVKGISLLDELGYWKTYLPELARLKGLVQNKYHTKDAWEHTLHVVANVPARPLLRVAALFHDLGKYETASKECRVWGRLEYKDKYILGDFVLEGKDLKRWVNQNIEVLGGRLDHYPDKIVVKKVWPAPSDKRGFEWVPDGKRHFLNHEYESAKLVKRILPRFKWSMVLNLPGRKGEEELLKLVENHMKGTLTFMSEMRDGQLNNRIIEKKARKLAWDIGFDSRLFNKERVMDFLDLWKADFNGGKVREVGDQERLNFIQEKVKEAADDLNENWQNIDWRLFDEFAAQKGLKGKTYGDFRTQVRRSLLISKEKLSQDYLEDEFKLFLTKKMQN